MVLHDCDWWCITEGLGDFLKTITGIRYATLCVCVFVCLSVFPMFSQDCHQGVIEE